MIKMVIAFLIAHVFLGETLPAAGVIGAVLVLAGVAFAGWPISK